MRRALPLTVLTLLTANLVTAPTPAAASGTLDTAAVLAAPRPTCEVTLTPSTIASSQDIVVSGQTTGLKDWVTALLDPTTVSLWGLGGENDLTTVRFSLAAHPALSDAPIGSGVVVDGASALETQKDRLFGSAAPAFASAIGSMNMLGVAASGGSDPGPGDFIMRTLDNTETSSFTFLATTIDAAITTWGLTDPYPLTLDVVIALTVTDGTTTRGVILPCTPPTPASTPTPPPAVTCDTATLQAGGTAGCTVSGAPAGIDFLWRAAVNPTIAEGVLTTGPDGTGTLAVPLPGDSAGSMLTVELVAWTGPIEVGVIAPAAAGGPVPTRIDAGGGPATVGRSTSDGQLGLSVLGLMVVGLVAPAVRTRTADRAAVRTPAG